MGYCSDPSMVRVDFFKKSGKWYTTEEMVWDRYLSKEDGELELIHETFKRCLKQEFGRSFRGMIAVCLKPYHEASHPLMTDWD